MDLLEPGLGLIFWSLVCFAVLFLLLKKFAWKPVLATVEAREKRIDESLANAEKAQKELEEIKVKCESLLNEAYKQQESIVKEANQIRDKIVSEAKVKAEEEGRRLIEKATQEIANLQQKAEEAVKEEVRLLSVAIAEKVLASEFKNPEVQEKFIKSQIDEISLN